MYRKFYPEQHHSDKTWNEHEKLSLLQSFIHYLKKIFQQLMNIMYQFEL